MSTASLSSLVIQETKAAIYAKALQFATTVGLPVTSWYAGDPTRSLYHFLAEQLSIWEPRAADYVASAVLSFAAELEDTSWLKLVAYETYGYTAREATYATTTVTLSNAGGGLYPIEIGALVLKSSTSDKTYRNTTGGTLASGPGTTLDITVVADEAGSGSSAGAGEIDTLVTTLLEVTCTNAAAAIALDEETPDSIVAGCRAKLGSLSPNGPADAYDYVVRNSELTGTTAITRSRTHGNSTTGAVTIYVAGPTGAVAAGDVTLAQAAVEEWATPLCITPTVVNSSAVTIPVTYTLEVYSGVNQTELEIKTAVETALQTLFSSFPIGGDDFSSGTGYVYRSKILATIASVYPDHTFNVTVAAPAGDTSLTTAQVASLGTITPTITFAEDP